MTSSVQLKSKVCSKDWGYLGKTYRWTKTAPFTGQITCKCKDCRKFVKGLLKDKQLKEVRNSSHD